MTIRFSKFVLIIITTFGIFNPLITKADTCLGGVLYDTNADNTGKSCTEDTTTTAPAPASVPGNGGIFSCSAPGATSVAASSAIGGTYVPVFDAAVALNTGTQTYKECVLKQLFVQQRLALTDAYVTQNYRLVSTGRNGNPYWVVNYGREEGKVDRKAVVDTFNSRIYDAINPVYRNSVQTTLLRNYEYTTQTPGNALKCPYQGLQAALDGKTSDVFGALDAFITYPACNSHEALVLSKSQLDSNRAYARNEWVTRLNWNNGIYDARDANGNVVVPGIFLNAIGTQSITSGFRQLENANDIGQMVGSFFAGLGSQLLSGPTSVASVQAYLDKSVQQQQGSLAASVVGTALTNLNQIFSWEQQYNDAQQQMASSLNGAIAQLRSAENKCWVLIEQNVCSATASSTPSSGTCTGKSGGTLTIATSTAFSNAVIVNGNFATLATSLKTRIDISNQNLTTINTLIVGVQSSDPATRNTALQQLETIVTSNVLHTQTNVNQATDELTALKAALNDTSTGLVTTAIHRWAGDDSSGGTGTIAWNGDLSSDAGWCNINKKQTLDNWTTKWTH